VSGKTKKNQGEGGKKPRGEAGEGGEQTSKEIISAMGQRSRSQYLGSTEGKTAEEKWMQKKFRFDNRLIRKRDRGAVTRSTEKP